MLKLINDTTGTYQLTVEYQGREYKYVARRISSHIGDENWFVWAANKRMMDLIYNTARKELRENLLPGQPPSIPADFIAAMLPSFINRK